MSDQPKHPDRFARYEGDALHAILDKAGAIAIDGKGALSDPPRLMSVPDRIERMGNERMWWHEERKEWASRFRHAPTPSLVSLPRTGDGVYIVPGMVLYGEMVDSTIDVMGTVKYVGAKDVVFAWNDVELRTESPQKFYSTRDAAEKARAEK